MYYNSRFSSRWVGSSVTASAAYRQGLTDNVEATVCLFLGYSATLCYPELLALMGPAGNSEAYRNRPGQAALASQEMRVAKSLCPYRRSIVLSCHRRVAAIPFILSFTLSSRTNYD
jgi:hypothetical protein